MNRLPEKDLQAIQAHVEVRATIFHLAYQWVKENGYTQSECLHFATLLLTLTFKEQNNSTNSEAALSAFMKSMTPGGQA